MSNKQTPHQAVTAQADVATGTGAAHDPGPTTSYTVPATAQDQYELGRRLAPPNKEANATRKVGRDAHIARAIQLRAEKLTVAQIAKRMAREDKRDGGDYDQGTVRRWLRDGR